LTNTDTVVNNLQSRGQSNATTGHWPDVLHRLGGLFQKDVFNTWFASLNCLEESEMGVIIGVQSEFAAIWIEDNYLDIIKKQFAESYGAAIEVRLQVVEAPAANSRLATNTEVPVAPSRGSATAPSTFDRPMSAMRPAAPANARTTRSIAPQRNKVQLNPRYTFDNFVVGSSNQLAHAASMAVAQNVGSAYNPLFIYGDTGLGKTHLMQAVAHSILETKPDAKVMYFSCEKFTNDFLKAIQEHSLTAFRKRYRSADIILIDDIQFLAQKERTQEEFFHTFNELFESQKQICLTSDRPASEIKALETRLVSRFQWGMVTDIQAPDLETRVAIMRRKANLLNANISDDILAFLAKTITRNVRRLEGALTRVASYASLVSGSVELPKVEQLLADILQEEAQNQLTIDKIQKRVVDYYNLRPSDMQSKRRPAGIAFPRQVAMYLCRILTTHSLMEIGENFGGRDHGTVIHACKTVENMMDQDESIKRAVEFLTTQLGRAV